MRTISTKPAKRLYWTFIAYIFTVAFMGFPALNSSAQNPLAPALGFGAFIKGDVTVQGTESEGPFALSGNLTLSGTYNFNAHNVGTFTSSKGNLIGLYVGGYINYGVNGVKVQNSRYIKLGNLTNTATISYPITRLNGTNGNYIEYNGGTQPATDPVNPIAVAETIDFTTAFVTMQNSSTNISKCTTNVTIKNANGNLIQPSDIPNNNQTKLVMAANKVNVLNLTGTQFNGIQTLTYDNVTPSATSPLVINIDASGTFNWTPYNGNAANYTPYVLFNFYNTTTLNITSGGDPTGTVFAPKAGINKTNGSNLTGQVVGTSFTHNGGELHYQAFMASIPGCGDPTPVELVAFDAKTTSDQRVKLTWTTNSEKNSSFFQLERSKDLQTFTVLGRVAAAVQSTKQLNYAFFDESPFIGTSYYRMRQVDMDGTQHLYRPISILNNGTGVAFFKAYPNPSDGTQTFVRVENPATATIRLMTLGGTELPVKQSITDSETVQLNPGSPLKPGVYLISIREQAGQRTTKWVVQ